MKKHILVVSLLVALPGLALADKADQCALNSTCSIGIRGLFNKQMKTTGIEAGKTYTCVVSRGKGADISIKNITVSKGMSYDLKGKRFDKAFVIHGPKSGSGTIEYTLYNHNGPWNTINLQYKCS